MRIAGLVLLHFTDVDLGEQAINEVEAHAEASPRKRNANWNRGQKACEGIGPVRTGVIELIIGFADKYPFAPPF
jgi:hypothetical protein